MIKKCLVLYSSQLDLDKNLNVSLQCKTFGSNFTENIMQAFQMYLKPLLGSKDFILQDEKHKNKVVEFIT